MRFVYPWILWTLVPVAILLWEMRRRSASRRETDLRAMAGSRVAELTPGFRPARVRTKGRLRAFAVALTIFALARPQWGSHLTEIRKEGVDIVFAVDTSLSMLAEDLKPNRLERARLEIESILDALGGNRVGLVAFAGSAFIQCPLTLDHGALRLFLDGLSTDLIPRPGTDLETALRRSIDAFPDDTASRVIVLLSDGEGFEGDLDSAARILENEGVIVHAVGIGSPEGEPIPLRDEAGQPAGYKTDEAGQTVMTRLDESALSQLALATGGRYYRVSLGAFALDQVLDEIASMVRSETESRFVTEFEDRFQVPLAIACLLLLVDAGLPAGRWAAALLALVVVSTPARAADDPAKVAGDGHDHYMDGNFEEALAAYKQAALDAPERADLSFNVGTTLLKLGETDDALGHLQRTVDHSVVDSLARDARFNQGNALLEAGRLEEAVGAYQAALDLDPTDEDAKYNLELTLRRKQEQEQQDQQDQDQQDQDQDQQEKGEDSEDKNSSSPEDPPEEEDENSEPPESEEDPESAPEEPDSEDSQGEPEPLDREMAERILDAIAEDEEDLHKQRAQFAVPAGDTPEKDW